MNDINALTRELYHVSVRSLLFFANVPQKAAYAVVNDIMLEPPKQSTFYRHVENDKLLSDLMNLSEAHFLIEELFKNEAVIMKRAFDLNKISRLVFVDIAKNNDLFDDELPLPQEIVNSDNTNRYITHDQSVDDHDSDRPQHTEHQDDAVSNNNVDVGVGNTLSIDNHLPPPHADYQDGLDNHTKSMHDATNYIISNDEPSFDADDYLNKLTNK